MSKIIFNAFEISRLEANPNVLNVSERSISYHPDFKVQAVKENLNGKNPQQIFLDYGFDLDMIGLNRPRECLKRWRRAYEKHGVEGFYTEHRGKTGRPATKTLLLEEKLKRTEARIAFLEAENEFLKKLDIIERKVLKKKH